MNGSHGIRSLKNPDTKYLFPILKTSLHTTVSVSPSGTKSVINPIIIEIVKKDSKRGEGVGVDSPSTPKHAYQA